MRLSDLSSDPPLQLPDRQIKAVLRDIHLPRPAPQRVNCFVLSEPTLPHKSREQSVCHVQLPPAVIGRTGS
jgi:hypothetical protein